jgi:DNA-binding transcriptional MerR regulator
MRMQELEQRTGVHREVIRIYLRHGLIPEPQRPSRTRAVYDESHVRTIAAVRRLQTEDRLSLPEIKALITGGRAEDRIAPGAVEQLERLVSHRSGTAEPPVTIAALAERYPHAAEDARTLAAIGLIQVIETPQGDSLSFSSAQLVRIWGEMRESGFTAAIDYAPDILGFYRRAADFVGAWEARTFHARTNGRVPLDQAAQMVEHALPLMLDFFGHLRRQSFFAHLERLQGEWPDAG